MKLVTERATAHRLEWFFKTPIWLWLVLRCVSFIVATLALVYKLGGRASGSIKVLVFGPWDNYDAEYYVRIVSIGYQHGDITSGFHPLYPWTARVLFGLTKDPLLSLLLVSTIAGLLLTISFYRLALLETTSDRAWTATALLLCWPISIAIFAPYTEALFLLLAVSCLLSARTQRFWLSGLVGGLATLTRQHGIFLCIPIAWELWEASGRRWHALVHQWRRLLAIVLVPLGYAVWIIFRALVISDVTPNFSTPQSFIYSVMISSTAHDVYKDQQFLLPFVAIWKAAVVFCRGGVHRSAYGDVFFATLFAAMLAFGWRHLRWSYRLYSVAILLIAFSYHTGTEFNPYVSLPRHTLPAFPIFFGVAKRYEFKRLGFVLFVLALSQALYLCCFVWESWVL